MKVTTFNPIDNEEEIDKLGYQWESSLVLGVDYYLYDKQYWVHGWASIIPISKGLTDYAFIYETGDIDFDRADEQLNMTLEDARGNMLRSRDANEASEETGQEGQKEDAGEEESKEDDAPEEETGGEESGNYGAEEPAEPSSALEGGNVLVMLLLVLEKMKR